MPLIGLISRRFFAAGVNLTIYDGIDREPTSKMYKDALKVSVQEKYDSIIGIGGGSALDVAKVVAALRNNSQKVEDVYGINLLKSRTTHLVCLPTTSGTGSEVSPNSLLIDERDQMKKGIISPFLIPNAAYVDPDLTETVPPAITASTGMDALTHCIEAYVNKYAHPLIDLFALEGIRLVADNLKDAVSDGRNREARLGMARASLYGGLCLGPVNTAAVHALAYPLGTEFHIAHGLSNAILLPYVSEYNLTSAPDRYSQIALAMGVEGNNSNVIQMAEAGIAAIKRIIAAINLPSKLSDINIPVDALPGLAEQALKVERLLRNNPRTFLLEDIIDIYRRAF
jgi:alcohol dehydrogenase class IV